MPSGTLLPSCCHLSLCCILGELVETRVARLLEPPALPPEEEPRRSMDRCGLSARGPCSDGHLNPGACHALVLWWFESQRILPGSWRSGGWTVTCFEPSSSFASWGHSMGSGRPGAGHFPLRCLQWGSQWGSPVATDGTDGPFGCRGRCHAGWVMVRAWSQALGTTPSWFVGSRVQPV